MQQCAIPILLCMYFALFKGCCCSIEHICCFPSECDNCISVKILCSAMRSFDCSYEAINYICYIEEIHAKAVNARYFD